MNHKYDSYMISFFSHHFHKINIIISELILILIFLKIAYIILKGYYTRVLCLFVFDLHAHNIINCTF